MSKKFFTSDTHFYHANIIKYSNRPYLETGDLVLNGDWASDFHKRAAARRMTEDMIKRWNEKISPDDEVYHLGDFIFGNTKHAIEVLRRLNFKKMYFIWGNHDKAMRELQGLLDFYPDLKERIVFLGGLAEVIVDGQHIVLCHYAMKVWDGSHRTTWHLYGHSHGSLPDDPHSLSFDVGVDCHNFVPLSFEEVEKIMEKKYYQPIDHHGKREEGGGIGLDKESYAKAERRRVYQQLKKEFENETTQ